MKTIRILPLWLCVPLCTAGCSHADEADTSPLPAKTAQVSNATKGVESSNMTPEQKLAALDYLNKGAEGAQKMKSSAEEAGLPGAK
jgi:hypothetical protein